MMHFIVQPGDFLYRIAMQHYTTVKHLMDLNPRISDPNRINVGQRIEVGHQMVGLNPWWGNEYQKGRAEYRRGRAEYLKGRAEYKRGHKESVKHRG